MTHKATVLIVEDSSTQAKLTAGWLSQYDVNIVIAEDGLQGLRCVDAFQPDLIILDVKLPKLDGYQLCQRLKRDVNTKHIRIIMLTANDTPDDMARGKEAGADEYIPKNMFAIRHLLSTLHTLGLIKLEMDVS